MNNVSFVNPFSLISEENPEKDILELCRQFMQGHDLLALLLFSFVALECPYLAQTIYQIANLVEKVKYAVQNDSYDELEEMFYGSEFETIRDIYVKFRFCDYDRKIAMIEKINKRLVQLGYYIEGDELP